MAKGKAPAIKPLGDKVLVKRVAPEEKTKGGIVLPDSAKDKPREGTIEALGDGRLLPDGKRVEFQVKKGDRVIFTSYAGTDVKVGEEEYLVMGEDDILAVIE